MMKVIHFLLISVFCLIGKTIETSTPSISEIITTFSSYDLHQSTTGAFNQQQQQTTGVEQTTPPKVTDLQSALQELKNGSGLTNDSLSFLVSVMDDKESLSSNNLTSLLKTNSILILDNFIDHPVYFLKLVDRLASNPILAETLLRSAFSNPNKTEEYLVKTLNSSDISEKFVDLLVDLPNVTLILLNTIQENPHLGKVVLAELKSSDLVLMVIKRLLSNSQMVDMIINRFIGYDLRVVDNALQNLNNMSISTDKLLSALIVNPKLALPAVKEILKSPILSNYLLEKFIENQELSNNVQKVALSSGNMLKSILRALAGQPEMAEELLGLVLQHPDFANSILSKIIRRPDLLIDLGGFLIQASPLSNTFIGQLYTNNVQTITNFVQFFLGANNSVTLPPFALPAIIINAFNATKLGDYLNRLESGQVKTFADFVGTIKGIIQNIGDVSPIAANLLQSMSIHNQCAIDAMFAARGLTNLEEWALKFIDASGKPERGILKGNLVFMGNYDECLEIDEIVPGSGHSIQGAYCELSVEIPPELFNSLAAGAQAIEGVSHNTRLDLCLPKSCKTDQINGIVNTTLMKVFGRGLSHIKCLEGKSVEGDTGAFVAIAIFAVLLFLCFIGTFYDVVRQLRKPSKDHFLQESEKNGHVGPELELTQFTVAGVIKEINSNDASKKESEHVGVSSSDHINKPRDIGEGNGLLMAFSIRENGRKILSTFQPRGSLTCLNGVRVISMSWIILGHILTTYGDTLENPTEALDIIKTFSFQAMLNAPLAVDTFFLLSGLLVSYLFVKEISKTGRIRCRHMVLYYVHRFWRLTPLYMLVLLFFGFLSKYMANGPFDKDYVLQRENCRTYWWRNLLYINTLFTEKEICMLWSWYLSNDMMFYVISPLVVVPLALGFQVIGFILIVLMIVTHICTYGYYQWYIGSGSQLWHNEEYMDYVYLKPWSRVGVYAVGLALGYIIYRTKCKYRFRRCTLLFGWFLSTAAAITLVYVTYMAHKDDGDWPIDARIAHETICRPVWAFCISWVIFTCVNGQGGFINTLLSWSFWVPLTKLTYGAYLLHLMIIDNIVDSNKRAPGYLDIFYVAFEFIGIFAFSFAASFIFSLLVEAPSMALEKLALKKKK